MKKSVLILLLVMSLLVVFCAACGSDTGDGDVAEVSATMEPADVSEPEDKVVEETPDESGESDDAAESMQVVLDMIGQSVDALYDVIGSPNSTEYTTSCLVLDGEDGFLYYDGFTVSTVRYPDGTELIMGAY